MPPYTSLNPPPPFPAPPPIYCRLSKSCLYSWALQLWRRSRAGFQAPVWDMARVEVSSMVFWVVVVGWGWWGCCLAEERRDAARSAMASSPGAVRGWVVRLVGSVAELDIVVVSGSFLVEEKIIGDCWVVF
jgi:hypothetical protein